jgi:hypothetical protein
MFVLRAGRLAGAAALVLLSAFSVEAQPALTTIHDVLYKADGTKFNGYAVINWNSFEASDTSNIATQFRSVKIVDGTLTVKLVPTTNVDPPATYSVKYNSDGKAQFEETWAVPVSARPLRVRDVRISSPPSLTSGSGPFQESDIIGLIADLTARPTQGAGYATGRVIMTNQNGELEAVSGSLSDCVHVDGTSGPCGSGGSANYVDLETLSGVVNGVNQNFTLAGVPNPASSLAIFRNGLMQKPGLDFALSSNTVQFLGPSTPQLGDTLLASYRLSLGGGGGGAGLSAGFVSASVMETLCSATGATTFSASPAILGNCTVPGGTLKPGDRVEIRFDYSHTGSTTGFAFQVHWGATTAVSRLASADETLVTGRAEAAIDAAAAQLSAQTWGSSLPLAASLGVTPYSPASSLTITFLGNTAQGTGDALTLRNFTVLRYSR